MRSARIGLAALAALVSAAASASPCAPSATSLCLAAGRFETSVHWKDFQGRTGDGQAVGLTADTGYFWFFSDSNVELIVKVLDARGINHKFWVFFGALSNVEYTLTVRDSVTDRTKTYVNPSGQFASVGDTQAFDESSTVLTSQERVEVKGTAAPPGSIGDIQRFIDRAATATTSFTPCAETRFGFDLGGCRFHIEVEWDDGHGGSGVGQPVQLTDDTGYLWFFSPTNVELMVKVLDARPVNGKFWVFFGALSNVQYTITVVDRLTGAFRKYSNPSGTFASVGDTGAFNGGYSVRPVPDPGLAVSADLDFAGGSVAAAGADGTVFILDLPVNALSGPQTVTLTPVSRIDQFPFSSGPVAGVEIEPAGLKLLVPATLTIRPPSSPPPERTLPYSYARAGEDFILYPRDRDTSSLHLPLMTFGGYGVAEGGLNEAEAQAARAATGPLNPYLQRYALEAIRYTAGLITQAELEDRGGRIFQAAYQEQVAPYLNPPAAGAVSSRLKFRSCYLGEVREALEVLFQVVSQRQEFGLPDIEGSERSGIDLARQRVRECMEESFNLCVVNHDPEEVLLIVQFARYLQLMGVPDDTLTSFTEGSLVERCLRFELEFTSEFHFEQIHPVYSLTETVGYHAKVPLRYLYAGNDIMPNRGAFEGNCVLQNTAARLTLQAPPDSHCSANGATAGPGLFTVKVAQIGLSILSNEVWMVYDVGYPPFEASIVCDGTTLPTPLLPFGATYLIAHEDELSPAYGLVANGWRRLRYVGSAPGDWAEKEYVRPNTNYGGPGTVLYEVTRFFLRHTPDGPGCQ